MSTSSGRGGPWMSATMRYCSGWRTSASAGLQRRASTPRRVRRTVKALRAVDGPSASTTKRAADRR